MYFNSISLESPFPETRACEPAAAETAVIHVLRFES